jgi:hypothetical protein
MRRKAFSIAFVTALLATNAALAVPDVKIEVQCENVLLSWASCDTNNEYYLIQHRAALASTNQWETIASWVPADFGTNRTHYVHTGAILNPPCQNTDGGMTTLAVNTLSYAQVAAPPQPMVIRADGVGSATPLAIYPPGYDLSSFLILDPISGESFSGMGLTSRSFSILDSIDPESGGISEGSSITDPPETGFYRVVRQGVNVIGLTNGMTLTGTVKLRVEAGNDYGRLNSLSVNENGVPVSDASIAEAPFDLPLTISVNTTEMSNGLHVISASGTWYVPGADSPYATFETEPVTVNVFNEISFPSWMP